MLDFQTFPLFLAAALLVALTPGPGIFYVAARTLAGGRSEGLASSFGTGVGGFVHVIAGAVGVSALVMASAEAFTVLKIAGAVYLDLARHQDLAGSGHRQADRMERPGSRRAFREGIVVEALNPKTAAFFLAFVPQFVDPSANIALQFIVLGPISVALNTGVDVVVTYSAAKARASLVEPTFSHSEDATDVGRSHVRTRGFTPFCASRWLIPGNRYFSSGS